MTNEELTTVDVSAPEVEECRRREQRWLDRPQSGLHCILGWVLASCLFLGLVALFGGPTPNDDGESIYSTWAIAHGDLACAYQSVTPQAAANFLPNFSPATHVPPLWPMVSGGVAALLRIGNRVDFPTRSALGAGCRNADIAMYKWALSARSLLPTQGIGYLTWFALLAGFVALVRASGRGRRGWELLGVTLLALLPVVWTPLLDEFHPQDLLCMGLILGGIACVLRKQWIVAGVLLGLAVATQQFALLVLLPLFVVAPSERRWRLLASSAVSWVVIALPLFTAGPGRAVGALVFGTGDSTTFGGTLLWETGLRGHTLTFGARGLPLLVCLVGAWWVRRRLGTTVLQPVPLVSLLATSLSLRLVFEEGLFGYKFLALAVMILVLGIVRGRISWESVVWLAVASVAFYPIPVMIAVNGRSWGSDATAGFQLLVMALMFLAILWDAAHGRFRWYLIAGFVIVVWAFGHWPIWDPQQVRIYFGKWAWQLILVPTGVALAVAPLVKAIRQQRRRPFSTHDAKESAEPSQIPAG